MSEQKSEATVAIVGAGIAGLSCAKRLQSLGFKVQIFEKSSGPSGRMSTRKGDGWSADHGAQYFTARDPLFIEEVNRWIKADVASLWDCRLSIYKDHQWRVSTSKEKRYVGIPAMNSPGKYLALDLSIELNQTITQITHQHGKWSLHSLEAGDIQDRFDWLVLALPAPQALALGKSVDQSIEGLTKQANMLGCWTVMARFSHASDWPFDAAFINDEKISWISRNNSKPGRTGQECWTIHANPQWSQQSIELDKDEVSQKILDCAQKLGLNFQNAEISTHRWRYANGSINPSIGFSMNESMKLGLCGDWLNGGRVEGAWLSGHLLANAIRT